MKSKNILIILSQYYPAVTPNVFRWETLGVELIKQNNQVTILTSKSTNTQNDYISNGIRVVRVGHNTLLDWWQYQTKKVHKRSEYGNRQVKPGNFRLIIEFIIHNTWRKFYWPDGSAIWYFPARKKLKSLCKEDKYDLVISVGLPFTAHLLGKYFKTLNPNGSWIMDIEDPFCFSDVFWVNNFNIYANLNKNAEKSCFKLADGISVTNIRAKEIYSQLFDFAKNKIKVIYPLLHSKTENVSESLTDQNSEFYNLGYFGSFYNKVREPEKLLSFLESIYKNNPEFFQKIKIHIAGQISPAHVLVFNRYRKEILDHIIFYGFMEQQKSQNLMQKMDCLINIGNTTDYHLPSKIVEYLHVKKPIINLMSNRNDSVRCLIGNMPFFHLPSLYKDKDIKDAVTYLQFYRNKTFNHTLDLEMFSTAHILNQYYEMM